MGVIYLVMGLVMGVVMGLVMGVSPSCQPRRQELGNALSSPDPGCPIRCTNLAAMAPSESPEGHMRGT
jgi:hypothetical protein